MKGMVYKLWVLINLPRVIIAALVFFFEGAKLESDLVAFMEYGEKRKRKSLLIGFLHHILFIKEFRNVVWLRGGIFARVVIALFFPRMETLYITTRSPRIAGGLSIIHGFATIINAARIGRNCRVYQQVTIGYGKDGVPVIGDDVTVYAGAIIVGGITIGDGAVIGAGAVVNKDVPPGGVCVGAGFRVIRRDI